MSAQETPDNTAPVTSAGAVLGDELRAGDRRRHAILFWTGFAVVIGLLFVAPLALPPFWSRFVTEILIWGLLAMSSDLLIGYTGMVSFGHSAFFGLGMYGAAAALLITSQAAIMTVLPTFLQSVLLAVGERPSLWLALVLGLAAAAVVAAFVAYFATRLRDIYFAITTLIFSQIFYVIIFTWTAVTGGENGLNFRRPALDAAAALSHRRAAERSEGPARLTFKMFALAARLEGSPARTGRGRNNSRPAHLRDLRP